MPIAKKGQQKVSIIMKTNGFAPLGVNYSMLGVNILTRVYCLLVPDFTFSVYSSSCNKLLFWSHSRSCAFYLMASLRQDGMP